MSQNSETKIVGISIHDRIKEAGKTQDVLTKYDKIIRCRLGFHELNENICSRVGTIVLHVVDNTTLFEGMINELEAIPGTEVKYMSFSK
ncbi:MAG: hypothetical protein PHP31_03475 [Lentimicrobiaceae bacterium]|nr:hypothetical protein [Lentimicrobiaceae bacterium]